MHLQNLVTDDGAVSPVIGVILMVAITVILAAVIGTFVLGIGQDQQTAPQASWDFEANTSTSGGNLSVTHIGGDSFTTENTNRLGIMNDGSVKDISPISGDPVEAGDVFHFDATPGTTVRVVWEAPGGGKTQTVGSFDMPS